MRRTKIICTLGPATGKKETLHRLIKAGANIFRFNMSHAEHAWVREVVSQIRQLEKELERPVAILLDTQGPAIRTGAVSSGIELRKGDILELRASGVSPKEKFSVDVNYGGLINDVSVGDTVLVDSGVIQLRVIEKGRGRIRCEVVIGGTLGSHRHINLPGVHVRLPALTQKDLRDIGLGVALKVDFVALSFARRKSDIEELRRVLNKKKSKALIIAKIEEQSAVRQVEEIIETADAIMVARGDLGIEIPMEELPIIQRRIVKHCIRLGKPVIVATHMLESMIENPVPTRAEITDIANAVFEQADAIMLSAETTVGRYPVECVKVFDRVARRIERSGGAGFARNAVLENARQKTVASAVVLANSLANAKLIAFTKLGTRPRNVSNMRPEHAPIFAFTPTEEVYRQLVLCWGVYPIRLDFASDPDVTIARAERFLRDARLTRKNDNLVMISDAGAQGGVIDSVQLRRAK
jgi:pyruvate kinase